MEHTKESVVEEVVADPPGIVIRDRPAPQRRPVISAFIWGGKVRPMPTLPYGRWKRAGG
ncbi:MAG TPA: hypothetical protein VFQ38_20380 [Longimicrobiales bacterium]|nr:hypothetical protein [Longimicrobiales bacterium]